MFSKDFYPTPESVINQMLAGTDITGKVILEPSAGSGNIVSWLQANGAKEVIACENHPDLQAIISQKCNLIASDFLTLTAEKISHIDLIVANPPFSADEKHILHAWEIAPEGCEIIALCNWETLNKHKHSSYREKLREIIDDNGTSQNIGNVFSDADRKTDAEIGLIHLYKPRVNTETEFEGYFDLTPDEEQQQNGIMQYSEIRNIVNRYVGAVKMFDTVMAANHQINSLIEPISDKLGIAFGAYAERDSYRTINRDTFKKDLQKSAWHSVFNKLKMDKYITRSVKEDLNKFVEQQSNVPFTVKNVYKMLQIIVGTHASRMDRVIVEAFERICSFAYTNSTAGEGWKTNSDYKINKRFIHPYLCEYDPKWPSNYVKTTYQASDTISDIIKALCYITGQDYGKLMVRDKESYPGHKYTYENRIDNFFGHQSKKNWGQWYEWVFFRVRGYKKGTMHFEFIDEKVWEMFNRRVAEIKGWQLPEKTDTKSDGTGRNKKTAYTEPEPTPGQSNNSTTASTEPVRTPELPPREQSHATTHKKKSAATPRVQSTYTKQVLWSN